LDQALKSANVKLCRFFGPPTETNFAGALLTGSQSDCSAAAEAFAQGVRSVAHKPVEF
jgi:ethanolamine utilization protein EutL